jgi:hypothetical protein
MGAIYVEINSISPGMISTLKPDGSIIKARSTIKNIARSSKVYDEIFV